MNNSKKIQQATLKFVRDEHEKTTAMLESIGAIHGKNAHATATKAFDLCVAFVNMAQVFVLSEEIPEKLKQGVFEQVRESIFDLTNTAFHLAVGADAPRCDSVECACHLNPQVRELEKMLEALMSVHIGEKERCVMAVNAELNK